MQSTVHELNKKILLKSVSKETSGYWLMNALEQTYFVTVGLYI